MPCGQPKFNSKPSASVSSTLGNTGWSPYTDEEDAYTTRFIPSSLAANNRLRKPLTFDM